MKNWLLVLTFFLCYQTVFSQKTGAFSITVKINDNQRTINFYVPEDYDPAKAYPILWGWGAGMSGEDMMKRLKQMENQINAIIVCPNLNGAKGSDYDILADSSYAYTLQNYHIDTSKTVLTGFSMGNRKCYQLALKNPGLAIGIIGMAPAIDTNVVEKEMWNNITKVRIATIIGSKDSQKDRVYTLMEKIEERGGSIFLIEKDGLDHEGTNGYYKTNVFVKDYMDCYNFIMSAATEAKDRQTERGATGLAVCPNPASDYISVFTGSNEESVNEIKIYNSLGNCVMNLKQSSYKIDISMLGTGVYSLTIRNDTGIMTNQFMVVK